MAQIGCKALEASGIQVIAFSNDGRWLAAGGVDGIARVWDLRESNTGQSPIILKGHESQIPTLAFSPDSRLLATGSHDKTVRLWDFQNRDPEKSSIVLTGHTDKLDEVSFSPDGHWLATAGFDRTARLWDLTSQDLLQSPVVLPALGGIWALAFSPDGQWLATGGLDNTIRIWNIRANEFSKPAFVFAGLNGIVHNVSFSPDSRWLTAVIRGVGLWDLNADDPEGSRAIIPGITSFYRCQPFSNDSQVLATGLPSGDIQLWNVRPGIAPSQNALLKGHASQITTLGFSPDGRYLATGGWDRLVGLWRTNSKAAPTSPIFLRGHDRRLLTQAFSPDGRWLATVSVDGNLRLWQLKIEDLVSWANEATSHLVTDGESRQHFGDPLGNAEWSVRYFKWSPSPIKGAVAGEGGRVMAEQVPTNWEQLTAAAPLDMAKVQAINFSWGSSAPSPLVEQGRFAAIASTEVDLQESRYRIRAKFHDGVRVYVDGSCVIDQWQIQESGGYIGRLAPPEVSTEMMLQEGLHSIKLDYFHAGGAAELQFEIYQLPLIEVLQTRRLSHETEITQSAKQQGTAKPAPQPSSSQRPSDLADRGQWDDAAQGYLRLIDSAQDGPRTNAPRKVVCRQLAKWDEVFRRCIELRPDDTCLWIGRAQYRVLRSQWSDAASDYAKVIRSRPVGNESIEYAGVLLLLGDSARYQQFCKELSEKPDPTDDYLASLLARMCGLSTECGVGSQRIIQWAARGAKADPSAPKLHGLGLAQFRAGQLDSAVENLQKSNDARWAQPAKSENWFVLAMVYQKRGEIDKGKQCLDKARQLLEEAKPKQPDSPPDPVIATCDWVEVNLLAREATQLIEGPTTANPKSDASPSAEQKLQ